MPRYTVWITVEYRFEDIEASNEEEAAEKAEWLYNDRNFSDIDEFEVQVYEDSYIDE
jgi:hypothetical protein